MLVNIPRSASVISFLTVLVVPLSAADLATFPTRERIILSKDGGGTIRGSELTEVDRAKYSAPSEQDPSGNWGFISEGVQMSVRFGSLAATAADPIDLTILLRNTFDQGIGLSLGKPPEQEFNLQVFDSSNTPVFPKRPLPEGTDFQKRLSQIENGPKSFSIQPHTQTEVVVPLSDLFDLTRPDRYFVSASHSVRKLDGSENGAVVSGTAMIEIIARDFNRSASPARANEARANQRATNVEKIPTLPAGPLSTSEDYNSPPAADSEGVSSPSLMQRKGFYPALIILLVTSGALLWWRLRRNRSG